MVVYRYCSLEAPFAWKFQRLNGQYQCTAQRLPAVVVVVVLVATALERSLIVLQDR